ncbi:MAG: carbohydrate binding domain-containing protein [Prevotellamassilia sp.]|nr:carbohydrate binding domain-containing protein [Prevotellamassilia sp.]
MKKILLSLVTLFAAATSAFAGDIITNGGFESWTDGACDGWKSTTSASNCKITQSADAHSGNSSVQIPEGTKNNNRLGSKEYRLKAGTYTMKAYVKGAGSVSIGYVPVANYAVLSYAYSSKVTTNADGWTEVTKEFTLDKDTKVNFVLMNAKKTGVKLVDDFSVTTEDGGLAEEPTAFAAEGEGTLESPYNSVAANKAALELKSGATANSEVYVKGLVHVINFAYSAKSLSFLISPDGTDNGAFYCFKVTSDEDPGLKEGDLVVLSGKLTNYKGTPEFAAGAKIVSITTGISTIAAEANKAQVIYGLDGRRLTKAVRGVNIINGKKVIVK